MALFDFLKRKSTEVPEETRSDDYKELVTRNELISCDVTSKIDRLSVVYGCINRRASTVAQLPLKVYTKADGARVEASDHIYYNLLTKRPNAFQTPFQFWHWVVRRCDINGNAYVKRIRNGLGQTIELLPLSATTVDIKLNTETGQPIYVIDGVPYDSAQIVHFRSGYSVDGIKGLSAIDQFRVLFDGYSTLEAAGTDIARNAAKIPAVVMHPKLGSGELDKVQEAWKAGFTGKNAGQTAWLPNTYDIKSMPNGLTAEAAQYIQQKQFTAQRICSDIFGVPQHMLGLTSNPTYASVEQMALEFIQYTIQPILTNIEQTINNAFFPDSDEYVKFAVNGLLRGDVTTRINAYRFYLEHGVMTPNHINALEDTGIIVPADQGGDTFVRPLNMGRIIDNQPTGSAAT